MLEESQLKLFKKKLFKAIRAFVECNTYGDPETVVKKTVIKSMLDPHLKS
ncbi:hypothetical protein FACS189465_3410 [Clostridia bacterium]|nr:hypothetical protein FACS189465_3410 [Clostridia bacterium]